MRHYIWILFLMVSSAFGQNKPYKLSGINKYTLAQKELDAGKTDDAYGLFKECIETDQSFVEAYISLSFIDFDREDYAQSLTWIKQANEYAPFDPIVNLQLGKSFYMLKNYNEALAPLKRAVSFDHKSLESHYFLGLTYAKNGDAPAAIYAFSEALLLNPNESKIFNNRGAAYLETGEIIKAEKDFERAFELAPSPEVCANYSNILFEQNKPEMALQIGHEGLKKGDNKVKAHIYTNQGYYFLAENQIAQADSCFQLAYQEANNLPSVLIAQSIFLIQQEDFTSAIEKCNEVLASDGASMAAYLNRGIANEMLKNIDQACEDWEQAFILGSSKATDYLNSPVCNE